MSSKTVFFKFLRFYGIILVLSPLSCTNNSKRDQTVKNLKTKQVEILKTLEMIQQKLIVMESRLKNINSTRKNPTTVSNPPKSNQTIRQEPSPEQLPVIKLTPKTKIYENHTKSFYGYPQKRSFNKRSRKRLKLTLLGYKNRYSVKKHNTSTRILPLGKFASLKEPENYQPKSNKIIKTYKQAMKYMKNKQYIWAITLFNRIYETYPKHSYADNALFWIGICYYKQAKYKTAARYFDKVIKEYPNGNKAPEALLKKALCYVNLNMGNFAKKLLLAILDKYPSSETSTTANKLLSKMR